LQWPYYNPIVKYKKMDNWIFASINNYISGLLVGEDKVSLDMIKSLDEWGLPQQSVSANQDKFLQVMLKLCNAQKVLELGRLGDHSTIWLQGGYRKMEQ
jgi:predicted O-methyltransferase YrrM